MEDTMNKRQQFFQLFELLSDGIFVVDPFREIIYINEKAENMLSLKNGAGLGASIDNFVPHKGDFDDFKLQSKIILLDDEPYEIYVLKEFQEDDHTMKALGAVNHELADIILALDESTIIAITDHQGRITFVNQKFRELSKYTEKELIGEKHHILNSGYHSKEFFKDMWRTIGSGEIWKGEIQNRAKDGSLYWVDTTIVPFLGEKGKPHRYVSIRTDITKRINLEIKQQEALRNDFIDTMKNLHNGVFKMRKDEQGKIVYTMAEGKLLEAMGINTKKTFNKTTYEVFPKEIAELKQAHYVTAFEGARVNYEVELDGRLAFVEITPIKRGGKVKEIIGSVHDISELRSTQRELLVNRLYYQSLFEHSQDFVLAFDTDGHIIDMNPRTREFLELKDSEVMTVQTDQIIASYGEEWKTGIKKALEGRPQNFEIEILHKNLNKLVFHVIFLPIIIEQQIRGVYSIGKDITEQKRIQELNAYLAHHDELTKLPNRRWVEQKLRESITDAEENQHELAVLFIDLDRFKNINDTLGHWVGDRLLELVPSRLLESIEKDKHYVARLGGDEFMILCPVLDGHDEAIRIAKNVLQNLTIPFYIEDNELLVSASIGISFYPSAGMNEVDLMKKADIALYRAKGEGRNTYQVYVNSMDEKNYHSFLLERDLRKAIINDEFIAYFQPRINAITGETTGAEALIRWMHPTLGLISPGEFIPLAEEIGLIIPLGKWMKKRVCEQLVAWREAGLPLLPISVNISSQRFLQKEFADDVRKLLEEYQLEGKWLEFEITENSLMRHEEYILQTLRDLKDMGIKMYIDDFGTGYSSFNYLKMFKLDGIKIDRTFVQNISNQSENAGIMIAMIQMAHYLKMEVIAEGVETEKELSFLLEQNCHNVQGFYFGKPCPIEEFEEKFMDRCVIGGF